MINPITSFEDFVVRYATRIVKKRRLGIWKNEKRIKWAKEGKSDESIEKELKNHKIIK
jgi:hypothetical protein